MIIHPNLVRGSLLDGGDVYIGALGGARPPLDPEGNRQLLSVGLLVLRKGRFCRLAKWDCSALLF